MVLVYESHTSWLCPNTHKTFTNANFDSFTALFTTLKINNDYKMQSVDGRNNIFSPSNVKCIEINNTPVSYNFISYECVFAKMRSLLQKALTPAVTAT